MIARNDCPYKRVKCERHGDCEACREHHVTKKNTVACERLSREEKRSRKHIEKTKGEQK